jgi:hypothetical protein
VSFPDIYRVFAGRCFDGVLGDRHFIVMEKKAYLSGYLTTMTMMTLMTVVCTSSLMGVGE